MMIIWSAGKIICLSKTIFLAVKKSVLQNVAQVLGLAGFCEHGNELYGSIQGGDFLTTWATVSLARTAPWSQLRPFFA
jgi:hypothetical protein